MGFVCPSRYQAVPEEKKSPSTTGSVSGDEAGDPAAVVVGEGSEESADSRHPNKASVREKAFLRHFYRKLRPNIMPPLDLPPPPMHTRAHAHPIQVAEKSKWRNWGTSVFFCNP